MKTKQERTNIWKCTKAPLQRQNSLTNTMGWPDMEATAEQYAANSSTQMAVGTAASRHYTIATSHTQNQKENTTMQGNKNSDAKGKRKRALTPKVKETEPQQTKGKISTATAPLTPVVDNPQKPPKPKSTTPKTPKKKQHHPQVPQ